MKTLLCLIALALPATAQQTTWMCHADQMACPCPAPNTVGMGGCPHSASTDGGLLVPDPDWALDAPSVSANIVSLTAQNLPPSTVVLFVQGTAQIAPTPFGDGLRCVGGNVRRLGLQQAAIGSNGMGWASLGHLASVGEVPPSGGTRVYQAWFRNAAAFCGPSTFNMTNAVQIAWLP